MFFEARRSLVGRTFSDGYITIRVYNSRSDPQYDRFGPTYFSTFTSQPRIDLDTSAQPTSDTSLTEFHIDPMVPTPHPTNGRVEGMDTEAGSYDTEMTLQHNGWNNSMSCTSLFYVCQTTMRRQRTDAQRRSHLSQTNVRQVLEENNSHIVRVGQRCPRFGCCAIVPYSRGRTYIAFVNLKCSRVGRGDFANDLDSTVQITRHHL